jgi:hypothetical protein
MSLLSAGALAYEDDDNVPTLIMGSSFAKMRSARMEPFDMLSPGEVQRFSGIHCIHVMRDNKHAIVGQDEGTIQIVEIDTLKLVATIKIQDYNEYEHKIYEIKELSKRHNTFLLASSLGLLVIIVPQKLKNAKLIDFHLPGTFTSCISVWKD